ncbi:MAG TPA: ArsR family transcriptional regulator [Planctomycetota bacterium]|nr:ArsR family transcriptional regulator [Planctomycetota bacterium]
MPEPVRLKAKEVRKRAQSGAWLVCAYDEPEKFEKNRLDGAISMQELSRRAPGKRQELIFYCA